MIRVHGWFRSFYYKNGSGTQISWRMGGKNSVDKKGLRIYMAPAFPKLKWAYGATPSGFGLVPFYSFYLVKTVQARMFSESGWGCVEKKCFTTMWHLPENSGEMARPQSGFGIPCYSNLLCGRRSGLFQGSIHDSPIPFGSAPGCCKKKRCIGCTWQWVLPAWPLPGPNSWESSTIAKGSKSHFGNQNANFILGFESSAFNASNRYGTYFILFLIINSHICGLHFRS